MSSKNQHNNLILFEDFIEFLRSKGYSVGVDTHVKVQHLLKELGDGYPAERLKTLLAPVLVSSDDQQEEFYRLFDDFFEKYQGDISNASFTTIGEQNPKSSPASGMLKVLSRRRYYLLIQFLLILGIGYLGVQGIDCYIRTGNIQGASYCLLGLSNPFQATDSLGGVEIVENDSVNSQLINSLSSREDSAFENLSRQLPLEPTGPIREDISDLKAGILQQYGPLLKILIIVAIVTAFFFYESYWYNRKRLHQINERSKLPPYVWNIQTEKKGFKLYTEQNFFEATRKLRRRQQADQSDLDVDKSIEKTVETGGFPSIRYEPRSRPPEYLILVEKHSANDHQAMLFDQLIFELGQQDIFVERFFYEQDPRLCWKERYIDEIYLEDLYKKFPENRLIIIGNVEPFFDPVTDQLAGWTEMISQWQQVTMVSPKCPLSWGHREVELARKFVLLPSTTEALSVIVDILNEEEHPPLRYWVDQNQYPIPPQTDSDDLEKELEIYFDTYYNGRDGVYDKNSGHYSMSWLSACAVYPHLTWDLTLAFGSALSGFYKVDLVSPQNLFKLVSLDWFRTGEIPDDIRLRLLSRLDKKEQAVIRETLLNILKKNPPPKGSYAEAEHQLNIAVQEAELNPGIGTNYRAIQEAQNYSITHEIRDKTIIQSLKSLPEATLKFSLPGILKDSLYRQGIPALGLRTWVRASTTVLVVLLIIFSLDPSRLDRVHDYSGEKYFLENSSSRMRFHNYLGNAYLDSLDYSAARENYLRAITFRNHSDQPNYLLPDFNLSYLTLEEGDTDEAREEFAKVSEMAAEFQQDTSLSLDSRDLLSSIRSNSEYNQGVINYRSQNLDAAEDNFRSAVKSDSSNIHALYAEAIMFFRKGLKTTGANQQNSFNLAMNRMDDLRAVQPEFFQQKNDLSQVLDSIQQVADPSLQERVDKLLTIVRNPDEIKVNEIPLTVDTPSSDPPVFPPQVKYITDFSEGLALVEYKGKYGFIDQQANLMGIKYEDARPFSEGRAAVKLNNAWGYINRNLETVITNRFESARDFQGGWATVRSQGNWGMIDQDGKTVIPFAYESPVAFESSSSATTRQDTWAAVRKSGKYQFIDRNGNPVMKGIKFQYAENFGPDGKARVKRYGKKFMIDREGNCLPESLPDGKCPTEKWDAKITARLTGHLGAVNKALIAGNGSFMVTTAADGTARVWQYYSSQLEGILPHGGNIHAAAISPDSRLIATGSDNQLVKFWRKNSAGVWSLSQTFEGARGAIWSLAFSPDSRYVAAGAADQMIRVYDLGTGELTSTLTGHTIGSVQALAFTPDGQTLISGGEDESVRMWNWKEGRQTGTLNDRIGKVQALDISPDGKRLALGTQNNLVKIYRIGPNQQLILQLDQFNDWVSDLRFSPDGQYLLTTSFDQRARVWDLKNKNLVLDIKHPGTVRSASFSPDGKYILTASWGEGANNRATVFELDIY